MVHLPEKLWGGKEEEEQRGSSSFRKQSSVLVLAFPAALVLAEEGSPGEGQRGE